MSSQAKSTNLTEGNVFSLVEKELIKAGSALTLSEISVSLEMDKDFIKKSIDNMSSKPYQTIDNFDIDGDVMYFYLGPDKSSAEVSEKELSEQIPAAKENSPTAADESSENRDLSKKDLDEENLEPEVKTEDPNIVALSNNSEQVEGRSKLSLHILDTINTLPSTKKRIEDKVSALIESGLSVEGDLFKEVSKTLLELLEAGLAETEVIEAYDESLYKITEAGKLLVESDESKKALHIQVKLTPVKKSKPAKIKKEAPAPQAFKEEPIKIRDKTIKSRTKDAESKISSSKSEEIKSLNEMILSLADTVKHLEKENKKYKDTILSILKNIEESVKD